MKLRWAPAVILCLGTVGALSSGKQEALPLQRALAEVVPRRISGFVGQDITISGDEAQVAGFSNYLFRVYSDPDSPILEEETSEAESPLPDSKWFSLYVGYYESQTRGKTIHSPKNCLPGAGWEPLSAEPVTIRTGDRAVTVNRFLLQNGPEQALVLYWYQGRGRVAHDEYHVKLDLLLDAAFRRRSDEALVRIVVPVYGQATDVALQLAQAAAREIIPSLDLALPPG